MHMCGLNRQLLHKLKNIHYITSGVLSLSSSQLTSVHFLTRYNEFETHIVLNYKNKKC